jgi:large subunit ribosomal protein L16
MPKRVKFRKSQRGRVRGKATRNTDVAFGDYGLQAMESGWISARQIEAGRVAAMHFLAREGRLWVRIFPHKSVSAKPAETRMGKGKGEPEQWVACVQRGNMLYEARKHALRSGGDSRRPGPADLQQSGP